MADASTRLNLSSATPIVFNLLSSDVSQESIGDQRACERVIRSHTRQGRGPGLIANYSPKLDGRLQGLRVYAGHLSQLESGFDREICQMSRERKGSKRIAGRFAAS